MRTLIISIVAAGTVLSGAYFSLQQKKSTHHLSAAAPPCEPSQQVVKTYEDAHHRLVACGLQFSNNIYQLTVYETNSNPPSLIFSGDPAFKKYHIEETKNGFSIKEALAIQGSFRPFMEISVSCSAQACKSQDRKCLWRKSSSTPNAAALIQKLNRETNGQSDTLVSELFYAALDGDFEATDFFLTGRRKPASTTPEAFDIHATDLKRLEKLNCLD